MPQKGQESSTSTPRRRSAARTRRMPLRARQEMSLHRGSAEDFQDLRHNAAAIDCSVDTVGVELATFCYTLTLSEVQVPKVFFFFKVQVLEDIFSSSFKIENFHFCKF